MIQIAICDDELHLLEKVKEKVELCLKNEKIFATIESFTSGKNLLYEIEDGAKYDLILLDIEMPEITGMELAKKVREFLSNVLVIFVTSHYKYALDAYELSIFRYIPKNQIEERLEFAIKDAVSLIQIQNNESYIISNNRRIERIMTKEIMYISKEGKNGVFHMKEQGTIHRVRKTLSEIYEELSKEDFYFVDRGCIVNMCNVNSITQSQCIMIDDTRIDIAQSRIPDFKTKINRFWRVKI